MPCMTTLLYLVYGIIITNRHPLWILYVFICFMKWSIVYHSLLFVWTLFIHSNTTPNKGIFCCSSSHSLQNLVVYHIAVRDDLGREAKFSRSKFSSTFNFSGQNWIYFFLSARRDQHMSVTGKPWLFITTKLFSTSHTKIIKFHLITQYFLLF